MIDNSSIFKKYNVYLSQNIIDVLLLSSLCAIFSFLLYIIHIKSNLWTDEFIMLLTARRELVDSLMQLEDYSAPLYQLILRLIIKHNFPPEWIIRVPAYVFMMLGLISTWYFTKNIFSRRVAIITVILMSINPLLLRYGAEARPYSMFLFFSVTSMGIFYKFITSESIKYKYALLYVVVTSLLLYTHYYGFLVLLSQISYSIFTMYIRSYNRQQKTFIGITFLIIIAISIPSFMLASRYILDGAKGIIGWIERPRLTDLISFRQAGILLGDEMLSVLCIISFVIALSYNNIYINNLEIKNDSRHDYVGIIKYWWINRDKNILCIFWIISNLYILLVISYFGRPIYEERYALPVIVPLLILISLIIARFRVISIIVIMSALCVLPLSDSMDLIKKDRFYYYRMISKIREINHDRSPVFVTNYPYCDGFINPEIYGMKYYGYDESNLHLLELPYYDFIGRKEPNIELENRRMIVVAHGGKRILENYIRKIKRNYQIFKYGNLWLFEVEMAQ
jgi:hypothetical protein